MANYLSSSSDNEVLLPMSGQTEIEQRPSLARRSIGVIMEKRYLSALQREKDEKEKDDKEEEEETTEREDI